MKIGPLGSDGIRGTGKSAKFVRMSTSGPKLFKFARIVLSGLENPSPAARGTFARRLEFAVHSTAVLRESGRFRRNRSDVVVRM